ncbi:hypothetical protein C4564_04595 [Candidatus Microgenomates bacterium]|nr:MAG: hypothetical protein C4564_04595 [Candidatus Microgenomates bacterium]
MYKSKYFPQLTQYLDYLAKLGKSTSTIKGYKSDILAFVAWANQHNLPTDNTGLRYYLEHLRTTNLKHSTVKRRLSANREFYKYSSEALPSAPTVQTHTPKTIDIYEQYLKARKHSKRTRANYIVDAKQYIKWSSMTSKFGVVANTDAYINSLKTLYSKSTIDRKASSVRKFTKFVNAQKQKSTQRHTVPSYNYTTGAFVLLVAAFFVTIFLGKREHQYSFLPVENPSHDIDIAYSTSRPVYTLANNYQYLAASKGFEVSLSESESPASVYNSVDSAIHTGTGAIYKASSETTIYNPLLVAESIILISPKGPLSLYIKKQADGYFVVAANTPATEDTYFNWLFDNTEVYHSIY